MAKMLQGLLFVACVAAVTAAGENTGDHHNDGASPHWQHKRTLLETIARQNGECGDVAEARCPQGQCCSIYGYCGTARAYCDGGCQPQYSANDSTCAQAAATQAALKNSSATPPIQQTAGGTNLTNDTALVQPERQVVQQLPVVTPPRFPVTGRRRLQQGGVCGPANGVRCPISGHCCSQFGFCGPSTVYCKEGCQPDYSARDSVCYTRASAAPVGTQAPTTPTPLVSTVAGGVGSGVASYITSELWDVLFPKRNNPVCEGASRDFYNYNAFITAANSFQGFGTSSSNPDVNKRELAAFLGRISHETTGAAAGGPYDFGLCVITEGFLSGGPPANNYCQRTAEYGCAPGKAYYGRSPKQLSWNYNYIPAGRAIGFDGLNNPEIVAQDPVIAFKTAIWFWMTPQPPKPSSHDVMTGRYPLTANDIAARRTLGYGIVTNIINGGVECNKGTITNQQRSRIGYFTRYARLLGVSAGGNLDCANQQPFA